MICPHCGREIHGDRIYCPRCGGRVDLVLRSRGRRIVLQVLTILLVVALFGMGDVTRFWNLRQRFSTAPATWTEQTIDTREALYKAMNRVMAESQDRIDGLRVSESVIVDVMDDLNYYMDHYYINRNADTGLADVRFDLNASRRAVKAWREGAEDDLDDEAGALLRKAKAAVDSLIAPEMSDWDKELALHDYIVARCEYRVDVAERHTQDARGFFQYGACQCSGYCDTFWLMGTLAGLEVGIVTGEISAGENAAQRARFHFERDGHAWNMIRLDGKWYGVDLTRDDPAGDATPSHNYFNVPFAYLDEERRWDPAQNPEGDCAAEFDENYYNLRMYDNPDYRADTVEDATRLAMQQFGTGGEARIAFTNKADIRYALNTVSRQLANHFKRTCWYIGVMDETTAFSDHLPFYVYRFILQ